MKTASPALIAHLTSGRKQFLIADLYTFTLANGVLLRYATADPYPTPNAGKLVVGADSFDAASIIIERSTIKWEVGVKVDSLRLTVHAKPEHLLNGTSWLQACRQGSLDGAQLRLERLFMPTFGDTSLGTVILFTGRIAELTVGRTSAEIMVNSDLELLNVSVPRDVFQPGCVNTLFDSACGLSKAAFAQLGTVTQLSGNLDIFCNLGQQSDYYSLGTVTFLTGTLAGISATVKKSQPNYLALMGPMVGIPAVGDTFNAYPGCPKTRAACAGIPGLAFFNNLAHFRGFPYVPDPTAIL